MQYDEYEKKRMFLVAKRILLCIARNRAERIERIDFNMSLNHDLGLDGDDFDDFFKDINRSIRIDWTSFNFKEYFNEEGDLTLWRGLFLFCHLPLVLLSSILNQVLKLFRIDTVLNLAYRPSYFNKNKKPFTVADLILTAYSGKWKNFLSPSLPVEAELKSWQNDFKNRFERKRRRKK
ncbi:DUF1493 family protein [Leptospira stimsonii]|uniref:DUF1493 domain-containing protein n=1 Tax=Leptospira stimsonii TaxID=2202203 RepID=A0A396YW71_9LEPT|nr:DUF1493 family protein [Leptospira stimsonii]RHX85577.1 hypothetical protein DLM75_20510 [Leptospira stimsonii]